MTRTYCDVCKQEMRENYADRQVRLSRFDSDAQKNVEAVVSVRLQEKEGADICGSCALKVVREGSELKAR